MVRRIETDRLILRTVTVDDAEDIFKWASDPDVNKFMIYPLHKDIEVTKEWLRSRDIDGNDEFDLGFVLKETGELIGQGGIFYKEDLDAWAIGYNLRKEYWGQGLVPEAMKAIIDYVDKEKGIRAIVGEFAKDNSKSRRVMEKLGMTYWKDCQYSKFDCKTANCGRSFLRIVFDDSSFQTALSGRMKRDFVGIAAGFRRFISADHRWSVETRL